MPNNFSSAQPSGSSTTFSRGASAISRRSISTPPGIQRRACSTWSHPAGRVEHTRRVGRGSMRTAHAFPLFNPSMPTPEADCRRSRRGGPAQHDVVDPRRVPARRARPGPQREWDVIRVDDPHGFATVSRIVQCGGRCDDQFPSGQRDCAWDDGQTPSASIRSRSHEPGHPQRDRRRSRDSPLSGGHRRDRSRARIIRDGGDRTRESSIAPPCVPARARGRPRDIEVDLENRHPRLSRRPLASVHLHDPQVLVLVSQRAPPGMTPRTNGQRLKRRRQRLKEDNNPRCADTQIETRLGRGSRR